MVVDEDGKVEEVNDYYPFGELMAFSSGDVQPYKYNGKELDRKGGASIDGGRGRWYRKASGSLNNVYPEFELFAFARGIANLLYKGAEVTYSDTPLCYK